MLPLICDTEHFVRLEWTSSTMPRAIQCVHYEYYNIYTCNINGCAARQCRASDGHRAQEDRLAPFQSRHLHQTLLRHWGSYWSEWQGSLAVCIHWICYSLNGWDWHLSCSKHIFEGLHESLARMQVMWFTEMSYSLNCDSSLNAARLRGSVVLSPTWSECAHWCVALTELRVRCACTNHFAEETVRAMNDLIRQVSAQCSARALTDLPN